MCRIGWRNATWTSGIVMWLASGAALAGDESASPYYYSYFKDRIAIDLDRSRVAVRGMATAMRAPRGTLASSLADAGIAVDDLEPLVIESWSTAPTPAAVRSDADVESLVADLAAIPEIAFVSPVFTDDWGQPIILTVDLLIGFYETVTAREAEGLLSLGAPGSEIKDRDYCDMPGVYRVNTNLRDGFEVLALANTLASLPQVRFAESDMITTARYTSNDPFYSQLWGLHNTGQSGGIADMDMDAPEAWEVTEGASSIKVVVLDDGVQLDHPDLNLAPGYDFTGHGTDGGPYNACDNHGTNVAGCVSAVKDNAVGVVGIAPGCRVASAKYSVSNLGTPCPGTGSFYESWLLNALTWAVTSGGRVTNNSSGLTPMAAVTYRYQTTREDGVVHFAASGNDYSDEISYPASIEWVNAVGALNRQGTRVPFSNWGEGLAFSAPGAEIWTTDRTGSAGDPGDYIETQGTSFASPYAAGVAALILSVDDSLQPADVEQVMQNTCVNLGAPGYDTTYGWGFVNAFFAASSVATGACCKPDGSCVEVIESECGLLLGTFEGFQVPCAEVECVPVDTMIFGDLGAPVAFPSDSVPLEFFAVEAGDVAGYQVEFMVTRISGEGSLTVSCPEGAQIDEGREDYIFSGLSSLPVVACEYLQLGAILFSGSAAVGSEPKYLGDFTLDVSPDATPGTTFEITLVPETTSNFLLDPSGTNIPVRMGPSCVLTVIDETSIPKNRYISFGPAEPGTVAYRVEMLSGPGAPGVVGWVAEPFEAPEDPGVWIARLEDTAHYQDWSAYSVLNVGDCEIAPVALYEIRGTPDGANFGDPIVVATIAQPDPKNWADCVGSFEGSEWTMPDGIVNMNDVQAAVQKFKDEENAPPMTWVDLDGEVPNGIINMADIFWIVDGFKGMAYPYPNPENCE